MNKDKIYIHHHLGLGDHIICNGLVREFAKVFNQVFLFSKPHNFGNVSFMYRDLDNLTVIEADDSVAVNYIISNELQKYYLRVGHENMVRGYNFDESFYQQVNIDFQKRWDSFFIERDTKSEDTPFNELNPNDEPYALIHNTGSDGIDRIDYSKIDVTLKQIIIPKKYGFFDFIKLIENSTEIHCIDSSFIHLVNSLNVDNKKYFHKNYINRNFDFTLKGEWTVI